MIDLHARARAAAELLEASERLAFVMTCPVCGARVGPGGTCPRCGEAIALPSDWPAGVEKGLEP